MKAELIGIGLGLSVMLANTGLPDGVKNIRARVSNFFGQQIEKIVDCPDQRGLPRCGDGDR